MNILDEARAYLHGDIDRDPHDLVRRLVAMVGARKNFFITQRLNPEDGGPTPTRTATRKLKVYGGCTFVGGEQVRVVVATTSQKRAAEIAKVPLCYARDFWSVTGNDSEIAAATASPETMIVRSRV